MCRQLRIVRLLFTLGLAIGSTSVAAASGFDFHGLGVEVEVLCDLHTYVVPDGAWQHGRRDGNADRFEATALKKKASGEPVEGKLELWFGPNCGRPEFPTQRSGTVRFDVRAVVPEMIRTIRVRIDGLPHGRAMTPQYESDLTEAGKFAWTTSSCAQLLSLESQGRWLSIGTREFPVPTWEAVLGSDEQDVSLKMDVSLPAARQRNWFNTPCIWLSWFDSLDALVDLHRYSVLKTKQNLRVFEDRSDAPAWLREMRMWLLLSGRGWKQPRGPYDMNQYMRHTYAQMVDRLREVAGYYDPAKIVVYMPGWEGFYDCVTPRYAPDPEMGGTEGLKRVVEVAHELGYHLVAHFDPWCVSFNQPEF